MRFFFSFSFYFGILKSFPREPVKKMTSEREGECDRSCPGTIFLLGDVKLLCGVESSEVRGSQAQSKLACLSFKSTLVSKSGHLISDEHHALNILLLPLSCQQTYYLCI